MKSEIWVQVFGLMTFLVITVSSLSNEELQKWYKQVQDPKFQCPHDSVDHSTVQPLISVVDCDEPEASYRYDFKLHNGKKAKKGPFNGYATVIISSDTDYESYNFGFRHKKCIKVPNRSIERISGHFINDKLTGDVTINYRDETFLKAFVRDSTFVGVKRHFKGDGTLLNLTDSNDNTIYWKNLQSGFSWIGCQPVEFGKRCYIADQTYQDIKSCIAIEDEFYINCHRVENFEHLNHDQCTLINENGDHEPKTKTFNMLLSQFKEKPSDRHNKFCTKKKLT